MSKQLYGSFITFLSHKSNIPKGLFLKVNFIVSIVRPQLFHGLILNREVRFLTGANEHLAVALK